MNFQEKLEKNKQQIYENIELSKEKGMNRLSAILATQGEYKDEIQKELTQTLLNDGYKVSISEGELKILTIEW